MEQKQVDIGGKKTSYCLMGQGPLVVLLHGFAEDGSAWKNQYDIFPNNTLLIPDLPGSGGSEMIADMSMEGLAAWIKQLIGTIEGDESSLQTCCLIGHSMGGYIALAFAEKYGDALTGFGLFHSTAFADNEEKKQNRQKGIAFMKQHGAYEFLKTTVPALFSSETKAEHTELVDELLGTMRNVSTDACVKYYEAMMARPDRTAVLRESKVPVLFVMGRHDTAIPLADGLKQCHLPAQAHIHLLEKSGHMGMMEEIKETNRILLEFVENITTL